jgi:hypothetical protein
MHKSVALMLMAILMISSCIVISPAGSEVGVTNPSIPAFSVTLQTYPHYIPPTYGVDPSSGKAVIIKEGYTEVQKWIRVEIGGQPFIRYNNSAGQLISLYYNVRWKGNHDTAWQSLPEFHYEDTGTFVDSPSIGRLISIGFKGIESPASGWMRLLDPNATKIDFQVEALIGYYTTDNIFVGQSSGWSSTQTISLDDASTTIPSDSPLQPNIQNDILFGLGWVGATIVALLGTVVVLLVVVVVYLRRRSVR